MGALAGRYCSGVSKAKNEPRFTRPTLWKDVLDLARKLNRRGTRYILVGGYVLAANGLVRMTTDIDIAVATDADNNQQWIAALAELPDGVARKLIGEDDPFSGDLLHAIRINDEFTVDIMPSVAGVSFAELTQHTEQLILDGETIPALNLWGCSKPNRKAPVPKTKPTLHCCVMHSPAYPLRPWPHLDKKHSPPVSQITLVDLDDEHKFSTLSKAARQPQYSLQR